MADLRARRDARRGKMTQPLGRVQGHLCQRLHRPAGPDDLDEGRRLLAHGPNNLAESFREGFDLSRGGHGRRGKIERADLGAFQSCQLVAFPALTAIRRDEDPPSAPDLGQPVDVQGSGSEFLPTSLDVEAETPECRCEGVAVDVRVEEAGRRFRSPERREGRPGSRPYGRGSAW